MKILVAGGAGYIGSVLVPELVDLGYEVTVIDLCWFGCHLPKEVVIKKDLLDCDKDDFSGYDQVIFLAGISNDPMAEKYKKANWQLNSALPCYLAYVAKEAGVKRFIYASSCSVYGYAMNKLYREEDRFTCNYPYGLSKKAGEGCMEIADNNFSVISLRKGTVCGYSPRMRLDLVINTMFKNALLTGQVTVHNPSLWRPIADIRDIKSAYIRAIQADSHISGVYNITSDNYTIGYAGEVVKEEVERYTGKKVRLIINNLDDLRNYKVSYEKAKIELGYTPRYGIKDIVQSLYEHIKDIGDFNNKNYYNIQIFDDLVASGQIKL